MDEPVRPGRVGAVLRLVFFVVGAAFIVIAFRDALDRTRGSVLPQWPHVAGAAVLALIGLAAAGRGWTALLRSDDRAVRSAFYLSQLGKYIPGMVWQAVGQVGLAARAGVPGRRAAATFPVHAVTQLAAGSALGSMLVLIGDELSPAVRALSLLGLAPAVLLRRSWMVRAFATLERWAPGVRDLVPEQRAILRSFAWSVGTMLCSGAAFALLASSIDAGIDPIAALFGYALAWAVGFAAVPVPAGIGVREAVLVLVAGPTAPVIAASIAHRLVTIAAEAVIILSSQIRR